jgi:DNA-directed RNA polymerase subunit RPC12/RpoP
MKELQGVKCPNCGKKGLSYAPHPHAFGLKNYEKINCRYCGASFRPPKVKPATLPPAAEATAEFCDCDEPTTKSDSSFCEFCELPIRRPRTAAK